MGLNETASMLAAFYQKLEDEKLNKERFYIKSRLQEKINQIDTAIIPLKEQEGKSEKERHCLSEVGEKVKNLMNLTEKLEDKFSIFIIGDGNVGKSTVVNSLLGQEAAKMKFDPMTWKIDVFYENEKDEVQLVHYDRKGNKVAILDQEEAEKLIEEEEGRRDKSVQEIRSCIKEKTELLEKVCKAQHIPYREVAEKLDAYKERVWNEKLYTSSIIEAKWPVETNDILANFQVVDTPGLRQNRMASSLQESIKKYYDEADGIIWVLDMNKIAMNSTKNYIEEIENELFKGKACDQKRMLALLNRSDCIRTEEEKQAILEQAKAMYADEFNEIIPFSATTALKGRLEADEALVEQSGYRKLDQYIRTYFLQGANEVKISKTLNEIQKEEMKFQVVVNYYIEELQGRVKEHMTAQEEVENAFEKLESGCIPQLENMIMSYQHMVQANIERFTGDLFEKREDKELILREDIFKISLYQKEVSDLLQDILRQVKEIKAEFLDKLLIREASKHPLEEAQKAVDITKYFEFLDSDLGMEKVESHPIIKLMSGISAVKKLVDKPYIEQCKQQLIEGLIKAIHMMNEQLVELVKEALLQEKRQILYLKQKRFIEVYGEDSTRINQLYALKTVDYLLSQPTRKSTIVDYIKGVGEVEWNNTLTS